MSKTQAWQASFYVKESSPYVSSTECHLTPVFGILLRISRCMGVAPVRLRWCRGNSLIEVSRELVVFQRLIMILSTDDVVNSKYRYLTIRQLAQYHEQICDMVKAVDEDSGPILLLSFMLVFLQLLITPYNLMAIVMHKRTELIIQQSCWSIFHLTSLLVLVEPCHWMQDQMDHTRYLLTRLARRSADGDERFFKELELFILQIQMKGAVIAPMGVFTISRSLVASI
ncbi:hypothetical protein MSG28_007501 [Choristoneura fumiferana]|uniref:Uncharacterized protein n=1 Tax=Choristoneura fumiferana TaxID=7141 RepID=A0ACC0JY27_CHOFU|nr:hypothetical protein MSG28_007501 [Choristoneura fumiferana]